MIRKKQTIINDYLFYFTNKDNTQTIKIYKIINDYLFDFTILEKEDSLKFVGLPKSFKQLIGYTVQHQRETDCDTNQCQTFWIVVIFFS